LTIVPTRRKCFALWGALHFEISALRFLSGRWAGSVNDLEIASAQLEPEPGYRAADDRCWKQVTVKKRFGFRHHILLSGPRTTTPQM